MPAELMTLEVTSRRQWRAWLTKHHISSPGVWLVFHKAHTGEESIPYEDMVREALCFGWIDSLVKRGNSSGSWRPTYRRDFVVWIHIAKRAETRARRIRESIALLAAGKRLGLK